jgi:DNA-directed RNA polymerase subunit L
MPNKRFTKDFLNNICDEYNITLLREYSNNELGAQKFIEFICTKCNKNTSKRFEFIVKYKPVCHNCSYSEKGNKTRNTMLLKYGVKNISQLEEIKNKKKETTFKNYGVEHPIQSQEIKNKRIKTCLENHGVEHPQQSAIIRSKSIKTCLTNYGVEHPSQNSELIEKIINASFKLKNFTFPSGNQIKCQGYEPFALQELIENNVYESDIITGCKNVPTIWYNDEFDKKRKHFVDIYIPNQNKCIEVKSTWTIKDKKANIFNKQKAAKDLGYKYEIWVYDKNGNRVETIY